MLSKQLELKLIPPVGWWLKETALSTLYNIKKKYQAVGDVYILVTWSSQSAAIKMFWLLYFIINYLMAV